VIVGNHGRVLWSGIPDMGMMVEGNYYRRSLKRKDPACRITGSSTEGKSCKRCPCLSRTPCVGIGASRASQEEHGHIKSMPWGSGEFKGRGKIVSNSNFDFTGDSRLLMEADFA
jgi:hypothetical protein